LLLLLQRSHLLDLGFRYDTVVMEEAAQVLEVETFIPLLLQVLLCRRYFAVENNGRGLRRMLTRSLGRG
jgi:superfamily I DNA and/or RNA helicase